MHLVINQSTDRTEQVTTACIDKLYNLSRSGTLDNTSSLLGRIEAAAAYEDAVAYLNTMWGPNLIVTASAYYIRFADQEVESVLKTALNKAEGEGITTREAAATNLGTMFKNNTDIETFEELKYFSYTGGNFEGCSNLHTVDVGNKNISLLKFRNCANLEKINGSTAEPGVIVIPEETTSIGDNAFEGCSMLQSVTIPNTVTSLGTCAFSKTGLLSVIIPNSITIIAGRAFSQSSLVSITLPNTIIRIDDYAFHNAHSLSTINFEEGLLTIGQHALQYCNLGQVILPNSLTSIEDTAFYGSKVTSVVIGTGIETIGGSVFLNNNNCTSITIKAVNPPTLTGGNPFSYTNDCPIYVPAGSVSAYQSASGWSSLASRIRAIPTT